MKIHVQNKCISTTFMAMHSYVINAILCSTVILGQNYPNTKTSTDIDIHFGVACPDPYRWMEDIKNPETEQWFKDQADYTLLVMSGISGRVELICEWQSIILRRG